jgi:hypothetical protein
MNIHRGKAEAGRKDIVCELRPRQDGVNSIASISGGSKLYPALFSKLKFCANIRLVIGKFYAQYHPEIALPDYDEGVNMRRRIDFSSAFLMFILSSASIAEACGWYAISACSRNYNAAQRSANSYGGSVVNTDDFENFAGGYFCAVVGPKSKSAAQITAKRMQSRGAYDAYIKYSC